MTGCYDTNQGNLIECFNCQFIKNCILNEILSNLGELRKGIKNYKSTLKIKGSY